MSRSAQLDQIRLLLSKGPAGARQLIEKIGISQPTLSRALSALGKEIVRFGAARSIQYALHDTRRGLDEIPIYRVSEEGKVMRLGSLTPVRPDGIVMGKRDGVTLHTHSLPWWLLDMRPHGFLGRAYAFRHAQMLGLPAGLSDWSDAHMLRALMAHGHDPVGNLLLGDMARDHFLQSSLPAPIKKKAKGQAYARLAKDASSGDTPGSSAGGEQPKFTTFAETVRGTCHVLVKFTLPDANPITERWRDLLLAEHHALETLAAAGVLAARSCVIDHAGQRFLELERFDREGLSGRRGLFSLASMEAEFVGDATAPWPAIAARLAEGHHIAKEAVSGTALLYAFGKLIGNTDMHNGNLSFTSEKGRPYVLAPSYDMLPMGFAPRSGGSLPDRLPQATLHASVKADTWKTALILATDFLERICADDRFSNAFDPCIASLAAHIGDAELKISRLG